MGGIQKRYQEKFTDELVNKIIIDYKNKISLKEIKSKYHISSDTLYKILEKNGVSKTNTKNLSIFKDLSNPELQYWIGYICADGNIEYNVSGGTYKVSLFSIDDEVMDNFQKFFGTMVKRYNRKNSNVKECSIHSKELCEFFINELNITPNKGLTLNPTIEFTPNFLLGYFDGDGSISNSSEKRIRYEAKFTSGSKIFIDKIKSILDKEGIYSIIRTKGNAYDLCIERKAESEKFYKFLYQDKIICLNRKLDNFVALWGNLKDEKLGELLETPKRTISSQAN